LITLPEQFNVAEYFVDRNVREGRGAKIAIESGDEKVSYSQLLERTNRAGSLFRQLGLRPRDRVLLLLLDGPDFLYCFFGAIKIGAVAVPANTLLQAPDYQYLLNDTQAEVVVVSRELLPQLQAIPPDKLPRLRHMVVSGEVDGRSQSLRTLMRAASPDLHGQATRKDDPAFWLYSSGSTGSAKGCIHLHRDMVVCSELYARGILEMNDRDRCYSVARLFFAYGLGNAGYFPLGSGATAILTPGRPTPAGIYSDIERYRPTLFFSVPSNYAALLAHRRDDGREFDLSSLRHAVSAGEALPAPLFERFKQRFGVEILDALGSTETLQMVISNRPGEARPGSSGKLIPGYDARIVDDHGTPVPRGEIGNLLVKGESTCIGYWNQPEKTRQTFDLGWFRTGDKYYQDDDAFFWYAGRADDLFKVNGRWVSPSEVESALIAHSAVQEAAVIARDDANHLTKPAAYVVLSAGFTAGPELVRQLQDWVGAKIGDYKRPRWIEFLPELPKTSTGKLQRFKLRERQQQAASGRADPGEPR